MLTGFTATSAQVVLLRELMVIAYGNEISLGLMLASWLCWTSLGSSLCGKLASRMVSPAKFLAALQTCAALFLPATLMAIWGARQAFQVYPGELLAPGPIFLICVTTLSAFCVVSGASFVAGSRLHAFACQSSIPHALNSMYLLEAAGAGLGGLATGILFLRQLNSLQAVLLVAGLNLVSAAVLVFRKPSHRTAFCVAVFVTWVFIGLPQGRRWEMASISRLWPGFRVIDSRNSIYGNLVIVETGGIRSLLENGVAMFHAPDEASAEEAVHFALLEHPAPKTVLIMGGGAGGALLQALQHSTLERVDYVELDPTVFELADKYFPEQWTTARVDPRVHIHRDDGRLFLKTTGQVFDVIIVNLPAPQTAQLNRFYSLEFFREATGRLAPGGVFSFQLHAAEEYLSPDLTAFLRCIFKTLHEAFPVVQTIPGEIVHFFAARREGVLAADPAELLSRLRERHLQTKYVRDYFVTFRMAPDRIADLEQNIRPNRETPVNRDLAPIAYYFDVELWSTQFNREYQHVFEFVEQLSFGRLVVWTNVLLVVTAILIAVFSRSQRRVGRSTEFCVALAGLTSISLEVLLLVGFQSVYGYVYHQLAILIALFMTGMALGSWLHVRRESLAVSASSDLKRLAGLQLLTAFSPLLLSVFLTATEGVASPLMFALVGHIFFPVVALLGGALGGVQFALATQIRFGDAHAVRSNVGILYGIDLLGACLGTLLLSAFLLPLFGFFRAAILIAVANLVPATLAAYLAWASLEEDPS